MSHQDVRYALSDLETALSIIGNQVALRASDGSSQWHSDARRTLVRAQKALDELHEHPYKEERQNVEDYEPPTSCYCVTTSHPPCGFCTREADDPVNDLVVKNLADSTDVHQSAKAALNHREPQP